MAGPRVVLIPGLLGSAMVDAGLTPEVAREICADNLAGVGRLLQGTALYPCDKRPETLWGGVGSLHWLFAPAAWEARMTTGDGSDAPGTLRAEGLFEVDVAFRGVRLTFKPYASLVSALETSGADVMVFPYDWRLSVRLNAKLLQSRILTRWFGGRYLEPGQVLEPAERITFIGHSLGGLVARCFLESPRLGRVLARRLITIGTPHLGAPHAYLHFAGVTVPFPENPFYRWARERLQSELATAGPDIHGELSPYVLPGVVQTAVVRFMASAAELMPVYDFVRGKSGLEPYQQSHAGLVHSGTRQPALSLLAAMRREMVPETGLGAWLEEHELDYHFVAATGLPSVSGYDRARRKIMRTTEGDGTVPLRSAHPLRAGTPRLQLVTVGPEPYGHQRLCERPDVQAFCLSLLAPPRIAGVMPRLVAASDFVAMAAAILREHRTPAQRGVVLTAARIVAHDGAPLLDATLERPEGAPRPRLRNPPKHLSSGDVFEVESGRHGTFRYVWMLSSEQATFPVGGIVFLPTSTPSELNLVTFNVGPLDTSNKAQCRNAHHAEMQLLGYVEKQPADWRGHIGSLWLANRSREGPSLGYSPCNACCDDLAGFLRSLNGMTPGREVAAAISWERLYEGGRVCGHPTDAANVRRLRDGGWTVQGPLPAALLAAPQEQMPAGSFQPTLA